jgi:hypothetical protein
MKRRELHLTEFRCVENYSPCYNLCSILFRVWSEFLFLQGEIPLLVLVKPYARAQKIFPVSRRNRSGKASFILRCRCVKHWSKGRGSNAPKDIFTSFDTDRFMLECCDTNTRLKLCFRLVNILIQADFCQDFSTGRSVLMVLEMKAVSLNPLLVQLKRVSKKTQVVNYSIVKHFFFFQWLKRTAYVLSACLKFCSCSVHWKSVEPTIFQFPESLSNRKFFNPLEVDQNENCFSAFVVDKNYAYILLRTQFS